MEVISQIFSIEKNKSKNIIDNIFGIVQGLGSYTMQSSLIYISSMLRSSTLFGTEAYYTLSEKELLLLEKIDLECIAKILNVRLIHLIYLECGLLPARFQMQKMKLHYLKYLLEQ